MILFSYGGHREEDFVAYGAHFARWHAAGERVLTLSDPRAQELPDARWRRRFAELADEITDRYGDVSVASAAVLGSSVLVGAAKAVAWLRKGGSTDDTYYTKSAVDAVPWLSAQAKASGLVVPKSATTLARQLDLAASQKVLPAWVG